MKAEYGRRRDARDALLRELAELRVWTSHLTQDSTSQAYDYSVGLVQRKAVGDVADSVPPHYLTKGKGTAMIDLVCRLVLWC